MIRELAIHLISFLPMPVVDLDQLFLGLKRSSVPEIIGKCNIELNRVAKCLLDKTLLPFLRGLLIETPWIKGVS